MASAKNTTIGYRGETLDPILDGTYKSRMEKRKKQEGDVEVLMGFAQKEKVWKKEGTRRQR